MMAHYNAANNASIIEAGAPYIGSSGSSNPTIETGVPSTRGL
jgi:hypothetical protein